MKDWKKRLQSFTRCTLMKAVKTYTRESASPAERVPGPEGCSARFVPVSTSKPSSRFPERFAANRFAASGFENEALVHMTWICSKDSARRLQEASDEHGDLCTLRSSVKVCFI